MNERRPVKLRELCEKRSVRLKSWPRKKHVLVRASEGSGPNWPA
jgi:hypothetical protein